MTSFRNDESGSLNMPTSVLPWREFFVEQQQRPDHRLSPHKGSRMIVTNFTLRAPCSSVSLATGSELRPRTKSDTTPTLYRQSSAQKKRAWNTPWPARCRQRKVTNPRTRLTNNSSNGWTILRMTCSSTSAIAPRTNIRGAHKATRYPSSSDQYLCKGLLEESCPPQPPVRNHRDIRAPTRPTPAVAYSARPQRIIAKYWVAAPPRTIPQATHVAVRRWPEPADD